MEQPAESDSQVLARRATDLPPDAPWWARWLDANIKEAWRWGSVWWPGLCVAAVEVWAQLPEDQRQAVLNWLINIIPLTWRPHALAGVFATSMILRVLNLAKVKRRQPQKETP